MTPVSPEILPAVEVEIGSAPAHTVIWLHGLGADGHDFVPIVNEFAPAPGIPPLRFLFPHAPMRPVSINRGMVMRAWYDYDMVDPSLGLHENMSSLLASQRAIEALLVREGQRGIPPERIVLAGFSQGPPWRSRWGCVIPRSLPESWRFPVICLRPTHLSRKRAAQTLQHQFSWRTALPTMSCL